MSRVVKFLLPVAALACLFSMAIALPFVVPSVLYHTTSTPSTGNGYPAPLHSLAVDDSTNSLWIKTGASAVSWSAASPSPGSTMFGNGQDGPATCFDGVTTCLGLAPSSGIYTLARWIYPTNMTIAAGATVHMGGYGILGTGTLTVNGSLNDNGANASNSSAGGLRSGGWFPQTPAGASHGTTSSTAQASMPPVPFVATAAAASGAAAGTGIAGAIGAKCQGGGGGGADATNAGGNGGAITVISATAGSPMWPLGWLYFRGGINLATAFTYGSGGGGGADDNTATGGGGGAAGGIVYVAFHTITGTGSITANGGNGGSATNTAGGGGGGGGAGGFVILTADSFASSLTVSANGGLGGAHTGGGGDGGAGGACVVECTNLSGDGTKATGCP